MNLEPNHLQYELLDEAREQGHHDSERGAQGAADGEAATGLAGGGVQRVREHAPRARHDMDMASTTATP